MATNAAASAAQQAISAQAATAGFLNTDWSPRDVPAGTITRNVVLRTPDGAATTGSLYMPAGRQPETVVCVMHPREFMACHYLVPDILAAGCAAWSQSPRSVGNDLRLEHEFALFDVATGMTFLREQAQFRKIVLLGNSGGASLYCFYIQQTALAPAERIAKTPGGRPTGLAELAMPQVDGAVLVAPHPGQGMLLMDSIDPSIVDESDALSADPTLDPLNPANGFAEPPTGARYSPEFVTRYREAQRNRVARLDETARTLIAARLDARRRGKDSHDLALRRAGSHTPVMTIWRTDADLRCFDLSLDPSDRKFGTLWGRDPYASNYGALGFARFCTPEAWLSTWSGLSSHAALGKTAPTINQPTLLVEYTGDVSTFPATLREIFESVGSPDKTHERIRGDHHGRALTKDEEPGRYLAGRCIQNWLQDRFPG